ncbi:MAG: translation initiation factor IF-2 subunit beta [Candidatus Aenigmarchaeota archaeon]|nr:translation initiation factor IF-2 subunit beta [Candidatus Aenigmarchaeota archaeon]
MDYLEMLKKAREKMPHVENVERFSLPDADVATGKRTTIRNFSDIAKSLRRDAKHVARFLFKELAIPGSMPGGELMLQGKIPGGAIKQKIEEYAKEYVYCRECGKPDTNLSEEGKILIIKCEACGARKTCKRM